MLESPFSVPALAIHGAALHAMAEGSPEEAARLSAMLAQVLRERRRLTTRMLQALDGYWLHCDGLPKGKYPRGRYTMEDWWGQFERYRGELEGRPAIPLRGPLHQITLPIHPPRHNATEDDE